MGCDTSCGGATGAPAWLVALTAAFVYAVALPIVMVMRPTPRAGC